MSCSCDDVTDCNKDCNCRVPTYTDDPTFTGISVNVAVLEQKINTIKEEDAHIIELSPTYLSYASFQAMFFRKTAKFLPLNGVTGTEWQKFLSNTERHIVYSDFSDENSNFGWSYDNSFNLSETITAGYEYDLNIPSECWDPCSIIDFTRTLANIKYLTDVGNECNIKCSITLDEFFENLQAQGLVIDPSSGLPLDPSGVLAGGHQIYTGLVNALITANFRSCTPGVKDIKIKWPFLINFNSVTPKTADGSKNMVDNITEPSNNVWPCINFVENANGGKTSQKRSPELLYDTVDSSGNARVTEISGNAIPSTIPPYGRYTAYLYSNIHIK